jgi:hypothetical protein
MLLGNSEGRKRYIFMSHIPLRSISELASQITI